MYSELIFKVRQALSRDDLQPTDEEITRAIEAVQDHEGWKLIETAPKDGKVLACMPLFGSEHHPFKPGALLYWEHVVIEADCLDSNVELDFGFSPSEFTHWRPLPTPPQEGE